MPHIWEGSKEEERVIGPWVWVQTCAEAAEALASGRYSCISLDYCLDQTDPGHTGLDLLRWILHAAEAGTLPRLEIRVHSFHAETKKMRPFIQAAELSWKKWQADLDAQDEPEGRNQVESDLEAQRSSL
jgi:hypothetical protein